MIERKRAEGAKKFFDLFSLSPPKKNLVYQTLGKKVARGGTPPPPHPRPKKAQKWPPPLGSTRDYSGE